MQWVLTEAPRRKRVHAKLISLGSTVLGMVSIVRRGELTCVHECTYIHVTLRTAFDVASERVGHVLPMFESEM